MGRKISDSRRSVSLIGWTLALLVGVIVSGCGPLGGDDEPEEPPVTIESTASTSSATPEPGQDAARDVTPTLGGIITDGSPVTVEDDATPRSRTASNGGEGSPVDPDATSEEGAPSSARDANFGDGTSGATPDPVRQGGVREDGTDLDAIGIRSVAETVSVAGCSPEDVPTFTGDSDAFDVAEALTFRAGPGSACESFGNRPNTTGAANRDP